MERRELFLTSSNGNGENTFCASENISINGSKNSMKAKMSYHVFHTRGDRCSSRPKDILVMEDDEVAE